MYDSKYIIVTDGKYANWRGYIKGKARGYKNNLNKFECCLFKDGFEVTKMLDPSEFSRIPATFNYYADMRKIHVG